MHNTLYALINFFVRYSP